MTKRERAPGAHDAGISDAHSVVSKRSVLVVDNRAEYLISHRLGLLTEAQGVGYDVHTTTLTAGPYEQLQDHGITYHSIAPGRRRGKLTEEVVLLFRLCRLIRDLQPDIVHAITIRPALYASLAARLVNVPMLISGITGLGYLFTEPNAKARFLRNVVMFAMRLGFRSRNHVVTFQNPDDHGVFKAAGVLKGIRSVLIRGSGVDTGKFAFEPEPDGIPTVILPSRMLWHKGVGEFVEAARLLHRRGVRVRMVLVGETDPDNPAAVPPHVLQQWEEGGIVEWWGHQSDMPAVLSQAHIVCLPSYREGVPKVLLEAASCGRAIVTTDVPGCREVVKHEENGLLVPVQDGGGLAHAIERLVLDVETRREMGRRGRAIIEGAFTVQHVISSTLGIYASLTGRDVASPAYKEQLLPAESGA